MVVLEPKVLPDEPAEVLESKVRADDAAVWESRVLREGSLWAPSLSLSLMAPFVVVGVASDRVDAGFLFLLVDWIVLEDQVLNDCLDLEATDGSPAALGPAAVVDTLESKKAMFSMTPTGVEGTATWFCSRNICIISFS